MRVQSWPTGSLPRSHRPDPFSTKCRSDRIFGNGNGEVLLSQQLAIFSRPQKGRGGDVPSPRPRKRAAHAKVPITRPERPPVRFEGRFRELRGFQSPGRGGCERAASRQSRLGHWQRLTIFCRIVTAEPGGAFQEDGEKLPRLGNFSRYPRYWPPLTATSDLFRGMVRAASSLPCPRL
jgi:hypothetical protein